MYVEISSPLIQCSSSNVTRRWMKWWLLNECKVYTGSLSVYKSNSSLGFNLQFKYYIEFKSLVQSNVSSTKFQISNLANSRTSHNSIGLIWMEYNDYNLPSSTIWNCRKSRVLENLPWECRLSRSDSNLPMLLRHLTDSAVIGVGLCANPCALSIVRIPKKLKRIAVNIFYKASNQKIKEENQF